MKRKPPPAPVHDPAQTLACLVADIALMRDVIAVVGNSKGPNSPKREGYFYAVELINDLLSMLPATGKGKP